MVHMLNLLLDILHIQKFFLLGDYFFVLKKKKYSYIKFSVLVATILMSLLGQFVFANVVVRFVIYIIYIVGLFLLCYEEKKKKLVFMGLWSQFLIACLEEISKVIVVTASTILNRRMEIIEQFCIHIIHKALPVVKYFI